MNVREFERDFAINTKTTTDRKTVTFWLIIATSIKFYTLFKSNSNGIFSKLRENNWYVMKEELYTQGQKNNRVDEIRPSSMDWTR